MKTLIIKINMDNPEVFSGLPRLYRRLLEKRSDNPSAVKVVYSLTCYGKNIEDVIPFKVEIGEDDIAFIRGITETVPKMSNLF